MKRYSGCAFLFKCLALLTSLVILLTGFAGAGSAASTQSKGKPLVLITKPTEGQVFNAGDTVELWFTFVNVNPDGGFSSSDVWNYKHINVEIKRDGAAFDAFKISGYNTLIFTAEGAKFGTYKFTVGGNFQISASVPGAPNDWDSVTIQVLGSSGPTQPPAETTPEPTSTPEPVTTVDENGFVIDQCGILRDYHDTSNPIVKIPTTVKGIGEWSMACTGEGWVSIIIPETVTWIGEGALDYTTTLETVKLPKSLKTIEKQAFSECSAIKDVYYGGSQADRAKMFIGSENECLLNAAWHYAEEEETTPSSTIEPTPTPKPTPTPSSPTASTPTPSSPTASTPTPVGPTAAPSTAAPTDPGPEPVAPVPTLPSSVSDSTGSYSIGSDGTATFSKPAGSAANVTVPDTITVNSQPVKVTAIADNAFKGNKKLTTVKIGKNIKTIGKNAFANCTALKTVKGGVGVVTMMDSAFSGCKALKTFPAMNKLQKIGANAFKGAKALARFTIAKTVNSIGKNAFNGCAGLKTITVKAEKLTTKNVGAGAFKGINKKATFKCPKKQLKAYKTLFVKKGAPKTCKFK